MTDIPAGWPCALLAANPPSVSDRQASPTADDLLPQVLALTPRGSAWGNDEAGDGRGASPVMRSFWRAVAAWAADLNARDFELATQTFPSAITSSLPDWEAEYGLPDNCSSGLGGSAARVAAVRGRFGAVGGSSPAYFVCLAKSVGYDITIEEPTQFLIDASECAGDSLSESWLICDDGEIGDDGQPIEGFALPPDTPGDQVSDLSVWKSWIVHVGSLGETWFRVDEGEIDFDPLEGFLPAPDLECLLRRQAPRHTELVFDYSAL